LLRRPELVSAILLPVRHTLSTVSVLGLSTHSHNEGWLSEEQVEVLVDVLDARHLLTAGSR
jgi:hypothetical protein